MICVRVTNREQYEYFIDILNTNEMFVENGFDFGHDDRCLNITIETGKCIQFCWNNSICRKSCIVIKNCIMENKKILSFDEYMKIREKKLERICQ